MPGEITLTLASDSVSPLLQQVVATMQHPARLFLTWGTVVRRDTQRRARSKGGRRFWREVERSVRLAAASDTGVAVYTEHVAARQKEEGGAIEAKNAGALTIPVAPEAEGKRASEFPDLFRLKSKAGSDLLVNPMPDGGIDPMFVLRKRTRPQKPDPFFTPNDVAAQLGEREALYWLEKGMAA